VGVRSYSFNSKKRWLKSGSLRQGPDCKRLLPVAKAAFRKLNFKVLPTRQRSFMTTSIVPRAGA
jgi:hypothetical protein